MKKPRILSNRQPPGPDYQFTLDDLQRMAEQLGGRLRFEIVPKELLVPPQPQEGSQKP